jgi:hypothetical protein
MNARRTVPAIVAAILVSLPTLAEAQQPPAAPSSTEDLAKKLANPISDDALPNPGHRGLSELRSGLAFVCHPTHS